MHFGTGYKGLEFDLIYQRWNESMKDVYIGKGKLAGKGLYAARDFKKGELVKLWNLKPLTQAEFDVLPKAEHMFVHTLGGKLFLFPEPSRYTNHSSNPTTYSDFGERCDYALRAIKKDEPITVDAKLEVKYELETFIEALERHPIKGFKWLKGGYRNAVVSYAVGGVDKTMTLKRLAGNWRVV